MSGSFPQLAIQTPDLLGGLARVQGIQANRLQMLAAQQQMDDQRAFRDAAPDLLPALGTAEGPQRQNILAKIAGLGPQGAGIALPMMNADRESERFTAALRGAGIGGAPPAAPAAAPAPGGPSPGLQQTWRSTEEDLLRGGMAPEATPQQQPRGIRNNNPLNIVAGPFTQGQPGFAGSDGRFARFQAPEQGIAAADALLTTYARRGINTPMALVTRWAPPGDGNNNPPAYATAVARALGVGVNDQIDLNDPGTRQRVIAAMAQVENGQPLPASGAPQAAPAAPGAPPAAPQQAGNLPTPQQLFALASSGNPRAIEFVRTVAPLVQRENPNFQFQNIGGTLYAINPQNPSQRVAMGPAGDGPAPERVRQPDGSMRIVPRGEAIGMTEAPPPVDTFGRANTLRDEFTQLTKDYRTIQSAYDNIQVAARSGTGQGDMSMLYQFVKLLDPTSVVRESEFAMAAQTGAVDERIAGWVQRLMTGERLPDNVRQGFLAEANSIYQNQRRTYDRLAENYTGLATRNGLDPANVVTPFAPQAAPAAAPQILRFDAQGNQIP